MKKNGLFGLLIVFCTLSVISLGFIFSTSPSENTNLKNVSLTVNDVEDDKDEEAEEDLINAMGLNQRFVEKLYFAGKNKNWELADFYIDELKEVSESVIKAKIVDDGINISEKNKSILIPAIEELEKVVKSKNAEKFTPIYQKLIDGCNSCHKTTEHGFIQIIIPDQSSFRNQKF